MRPGVRLAIDVGSVRVGVARCDPAGLLATPLLTLDRDVDGADIESIAGLVLEWDALEVVIGLPLRLGGDEGPAAQAARGYAVAVARRVGPVGVRLVDERLSTVTATRALHDAGRKQRRARPVVDQAAAVVFLQAALDAERTSGRAPGEVVEAAPEQHRRRKDRSRESRRGGPPPVNERP